jgi:hypothetical protein
MRNRENIRLSHRVPGAAMGIYETANLGSGRDSTAMERYRDHIVTPGQRLFADVLTKLVRGGLLIPYFKFSFEPMRVEQDTDARKLHLQEFTDGALTLDDYLRETGRPTLPEERGRVRFIRTDRLTILQENPADVQAAAVKAIADEKRFQDILLGETALEALDALGAQQS